MIRVKRIYEDAEERDGLRILVDRLWPRGISKEKAHLYMWMKDLAPSTALRKWFGHDSKKWREFEKRYNEELKEKKEYLAILREMKQKGKTITLLYGTKDTLHNEAVILQGLLR